MQKLTCPIWDSNQVPSWVEPNSSPVYSELSELWTIVMFQVRGLHVSIDHWYAGYQFDILAELLTVTVANSGPKF